MSQIASPVPPNLRAVLDAFKQEIFYGFNCHEVGRIVSFNATTQTAAVQIEVLKIIVDQQVPYPLLTDCPVSVLTGGTATLTMPIKPGDTCLVLFNDRDLDNWFDSGNVVAPNSSRAHSLSDGLVLVGFRNKANAVAGYETDRASLRNNGAKVSVLDDGSVAISSPSGSVVVSSPLISLIADRIRLTAPVTTITGNAVIGTGASGSFLTVDGKVVTVADGVVINIA